MKKLYASDFSSQKDEQQLWRSQNPQQDLTDEGLNSEEPARNGQPAGNDKKEQEASRRKTEQEDQSKKEKESNKHQKKNY